MEAPPGGGPGEAAGEGARAQGEEVPRLEGEWWEAILGTPVLGLLYLVDRERERRHQRALEGMRRRKREAEERLLGLLP